MVDFVALILQCISHYSAVINKTKSPSDLLIRLHFCTFDTQCLRYLQLKKKKQKNKKKNSTLLC